MFTLCVVEELRTEGPEYQNNVFYFAGAAFLGAGVLAVGVIQLAIFLKVKTWVQKKYSVNIAG